MSWDKVVFNDLLEKGLSTDEAEIVIGIIAEHRHQSYLQGYHKGYEDGYLIGEIAGSDSPMQ